MKIRNMKLAFTRSTLFLVFCLMLTACASTGSKTPANQQLQIDKSLPSIVILGRRHIGHNETELDYVSCIEEELGLRFRSLNIIPEQQFLDSMYPYFEKSTAPLTIHNLSQIMQKPVVTKKLEELNMSHLIWIAGNTRRTGVSGSISCATTGCLGYATWSDAADYEAHIWDIEKLSESDSIETNREGTSHLPAIVVPIPILARVQTGACREMAEDITRSLRG
ncbi:hypothetical protein EYS14_22400 [Alteromonadaceae bacterium M269]|nr:hypothetical protein EYS14_22400 [Alteromonadaceae bacterium M269]